MLKSDFARAVERVANARGIEAVALKAVVEVEAAGQPFAVVNGKNEPLIRYEGHYFDRLIDPSKREEARAAGLASPTVGGVKNPSSQEDRWRLLAKATRVPLASGRQRSFFDHRVNRVGADADGKSYLGSIEGDARNRARIFHEAMICRPRSRAQHVAVHVARICRH